MYERDDTAAESSLQVGLAAGALFLGLLDIWIGAGTAPPGTRLAYLDPGAGSFVVQALVAVLAGVAVTARAYWARIKGFFGGRARPEGEPGSGEPPAADD